MQQKGASLFGIVPFQFRFRGQVSLILDIYYCFVDNDGKALHPTQIAKTTGISFAEVSRRLSATPELFVKLPARQGEVTRYRVTSSASARGHEEIEALLYRYAQRETWLLYAFSGMVLCLLLIVAMTIAPNA